MSRERIMLTQAIPAVQQAAADLRRRGVPPVPGVHAAQHIAIRQDETAEARTAHGADGTGREGLFHGPAHGLQQAGAGHAGRPGEMVGQQRRVAGETQQGLLWRHHSSQSRRRGPAGASFSSGMKTRCAPAAQGAT